MEQAEVSAVPERAKQGTEATGGERRKLWWAEASIRTDRMVSALENGLPRPSPIGAKKFVASSDTRVFSWAARADVV